MLFQKQSIEKMNRLKILNKNEKQEIVNKLKKQFGVSILNGLIIKRDSDKLFLFTGSFTPKQITELENTLPIERIGVYFGKIQNNQIRLSIEGVHILKNQITKNIFELDSEQTGQWMMGQELNIQTGEKCLLILKYKDDFLGCGKASEKKIGNYMPKSRRLRGKTTF